MPERNQSSSLLTDQSMKSKKQKVEDSSLTNHINGGLCENNVNDFWQMVPSGFTFCPTEQELIMAHLRKKVMNEPLEPNPIIEVEVFKFNPEQLSRQCRSWGSRENVWYFFSPICQNGSIQDGHWKRQENVGPSILMMEEH